MTPVEMLDSLKDHLDTRENFWTGAQLWRRLHDAQDEIIDAVVMQDPTFFVATADIALVANTATYDLPLNARLGTRLVFTESRLSGNNDGEILPTDLKEYLYAGSPAVSSLVSGYSFSIQGDQIRVIPTPTVSDTDGFRIWYCPSFGNMLQWKLVSGTVTSSTFVLSTSLSTNYTTYYGTPDTRDDYYNNMRCLVVSGTGAGQIRTISDYAGSTRTFTISANWATNPSITAGSESVMAVLCPAPERFHSTIVARAAMMCMPKSSSRLPALRELVYGGPGHPGMYRSALSWVQKRQDSVLETVQPTDGGL